MGLHGRQSFVFCACIVILRGFQRFNNYSRQLIYFNKISDTKSRALRWKKPVVAPSRSAKLDWIFNAVFFFRERGSTYKRICFALCPYFFIQNHYCPSLLPSHPAYSGQTGSDSKMLREREREWKEERRMEWFYLRLWRYSPLRTRVHAINGVRSTNRAARVTCYSLLRCPQTALHRTALSSRKGRWPFALIEIAGSLIIDVDGDPDGGFSIKKPGTIDNRRRALVNSGWGQCHVVWQMRPR